MSTDRPEAQAQAELLAELDLGTSPMNFGRGRPPKAFHVEYSRELTGPDIEALSLPRPAQPKSLMRIHSSHHSLARCLATGMRQNQAALVTGYSAQRVAMLEQDPTFQALVADYRAEAKSVFADLAERMSDISLDAIELLQERLHDKPHEFTTSMLLEVVKAFADRTGHGPGQEVNLKIQPDFIDRPPRESFDDWKSRRERELGTGPGPERPHEQADTLSLDSIDIKKLN